MGNETILVVDDEEHIVELLKFNLEKMGYNVLTAGNGPDALNIALSRRPKLVILDIMIPELDGYEVCKALRKDPLTQDISIIMLTAKEEEIDKILGLELGADDYITKPFSVRELEARVKAVLRRSQSSKSSPIQEFGSIRIDFEKHEVYKNEKKIELTLKEFELLQILIKNKGKVMTRDFLLDKVWGYEYIGETRTVDVHIRHLRQKIEDDDKNPMYIETVRGIGYRFKLD